MLGAPVPSPAPGTSTGVTEPEPVDAEPGDGTPIFESVRSGYLHAFGRDLPRSSEQQGGQSLAGQPARPPASWGDGSGRAVAVPPTAGHPASSGLPQRLPHPGQVRGTAADQETRQARWPNRRRARGASWQASSAAPSGRGRWLRRTAARSSRNRMAEGEARDPAPHPHDPDRLIADFAERVPDVLRAVAVASDGVLLAASDRTQPDQLEQLSAITAGLISLASAAARIFDGGAVTQALVTMARGTLVIMAIDQGSSLAVLTTATADLDTVAYEMTMLAEEAGSIFTPPAR